MTAGAPAAAQAQAEDPAALAEARQKFRQAVSLQTGGNWAGALALFREVATVKSTPQVQFNIAICEENLGRLVQALGDYQLAAAQAHEEGKPEVAAEVEKRLETLQARIPKIVVRRGDNADLARISVDGIDVGSAMVGRPMPVDPGAHIVEARAAGYEPFEKKLTVEEGAEIEIVVDLLASLAADVENPYAGGSMRPSDAAPEADAPPADPEQRTNLVPYIVGGAGVASLVASGVFFLLRQGAINALEERCGPEGSVCDRELQATADRGQLYSVLVPITLGLGVAGVGTGVVLLLMDAPGKDGGDQAGLRFAPTAPGATAGASLLGRF
jgi:hypothetical protein